MAVVMTMAENSIKAYIDQFIELSPDAVSFIADHMKPVSFEKGTMIMQPGDTCSHVVLITQGIVRAFIKTDDRDVTTWFSWEMQLTTCIKSFFKRIPSNYYIEALEDCEGLSMSYEDSEKMYRRHPETNIFIRKVLEQSYCDAEDRAYIIRLSGREKYEKFMQDHSPLINRISLKYIASYLGIRLETLSRIRNQYTREVH